MSVFLERLRAALDGDYEVMDELASGGMGVVYRARDRALDRLVAIKIIRPDLATASMRERFLREARVLASFSHPNIVPVHRAGETDGMAYYVMDFLHGETLADRLRRGPLTADEFRMVANDLLAALEVVHEHGVVHRDVKPSNVFMTTGRAVLSDFGISKPASGDATGLTAPGHIVGTPGYMPPEQLAGSDVTVRTDIAAAAMVLFEACTGQPWSFDSHSDDADWSRVPADAAPVMRRALAWAPSERIASAGEFRAALSGRDRPRRRPMAIALGVLAVLTAVVVYAIWAPSSGGALLRVNVHALTVIGATDAALGRALVTEMVEALRAPADMEFSLDPARHADLEVGGTVEQHGERLTVRLHVTGPSRRDRATAFDLPAAEGNRAAIVDSLARTLLLGIWRNRDSSFGDLPVGALPQSPAGLNAWLHAEAAWAEARWVDADRAYRVAIQTDSTCALCDLRLMLISRWLRRPTEATVAQRVVAALHRFPPHYQQLIEAGRDTVNRWAELDAMIASSPRFDLAQFVYGDELFHRGALAGRSRRDAMDHFQRLIELRPAFAPAYQHMAWVAIAEHEEATARSALSAYDSLGAPDDQETLVIRAFLHLAIAWRFAPAEAPARTQALLGDPGIAAFADLWMAPRYLSVFDEPAGVLYLGETFERWREKPLLRPHGIVAQAVALTALGRIDSARTVLVRLRGEKSDVEHTLSTAEFAATLVLFDSLDAVAALPGLETLLAPLTTEGAGTPIQRRRAAWMLALVTRRARATARAEAWGALVRGESGRRPFATLLAANAIGDSVPQRALRQTEPLLALDSAGAAGDPFFRAALHLMRAQWQAKAGDRNAAIQSLRWHENYDLIDHVDGLMQAADADVALGTIGRWRRARLQDANGASGWEVCRTYADVARLWASGDPRYRARGDSARAARDRLGCSP